MGTFMGALMRRNETQLRPAHRAGQRLRMEAAVVRVFVFGAARGTQWKIRHRGVRPIVGHARDQRVARPALRAVDERVAVAPVARSQHLAAAIVAKKIIRRNVKQLIVGLPVPWQCALGSEPSH